MTAGDMRGPFIQIEHRQELLSGPWSIACLRILYFEGRSWLFVCCRRSPSADENAVRTLVAPRTSSTCLVVERVQTFVRMNADSERRPERERPLQMNEDAPHASRLVDNTLWEPDGFRGGEHIMLGALGELNCSKFFIPCI